MSRLRQQDRTIERREAQRYGQKVKIDRTPEEQRRLDSQEHVWLSDMSSEEQERFKHEQQALWAQIPAHLQEKARKMAGGN